MNRWQCSDDEKDKDDKEYQGQCQISGISQGTQSLQLGAYTSHVLGWTNVIMIKVIDKIII